MTQFSGADYTPHLDHPRLTGQLHRIHTLMQDGQWRTLREIHDVTGDPEASISAQLRNLRKPQFGGYTVSKRRRGNPYRGIYEYQLMTRATTPIALPPELLEFVTCPTPTTAQQKESYLQPLEWNLVNNMLKQRGYQYAGKGVWRKP